jgi:hypothetical protein
LSSPFFSSKTIENLPGLMMVDIVSIESKFFSLSSISRTLERNDLSISIKSVTILQACNTVAWSRCPIVKPIDEKDKKDEEGKDQKDFADKPEVDKEDKTDEGKDKEEKPVDKKEDKEEKGKKFSLDAYADSGAMFAMLEKETEANKKMATDLFETGDANVIMSKVLDLQHKVDAFEAEKQMAEEKECSAEFAKCMGEVKGDIEEKEYAKLYEEGKDIKKKDDMAKFSAKVKAFAYENIKNKEPEKKDDDIFRFGAPFNNKNNEDKNKNNKT